MCADSILESLAKRGGGRKLPEKRLPAVEALMAQEGGEPRARRTETLRVVNLPMRPFDHEDKRKLATRMTNELRTPGGAMTLRPIQAAALWELREHGGLLAPIGVGHGKTLIALLAGRVAKAALTIILAPASTVPQLKQVMAETALHFLLPENLRIYSYAALSQAKNTDLLERLARQYDPAKMLIVADEAHRIKRPEAARTKRIIRFFQQHPEVTFAALSGTFTSRSLHDYKHLAELALREGSPIPTDSYHLDHWAQAVDVEGQPGQQAWRMVQPLWDWFTKLPECPEPDAGLCGTGAEKCDKVRAAFRHRLWTTPGVVATTSPSVGSSLYLSLHPDLPVPETVTQVLDTVLQTGERPDGEVLADPIEIWRFQRQMSQGFYYVWDWPGGLVDTEWVEARSDWSRRVRAELAQHSAEGYDSPLLVFNRIQRQHEAGQRLAIHRSWQRWQGQRHKKPPPTKPVWLSPFLLDYAISWLEQQSEPAILWYDSAAVEAALATRGVTTYGAGAAPPRKAEKCAMSIQAHGVGKNLQAWRTQLVMAPPSSGLAWEQLLGRLHRQGQKADEVECHVMVHSAAFVDAWDKAQRDAKYIFDSTGNPQKLIYGTLTREL